MNKPTIEIKTDEVKVSDGYHTFDELYEHRITLYIALCRSHHGRSFDCWRSRKHHDGSEFEGWFVLGIGVSKGEQITYHLPLDRWEETNFIEEHNTFDKSPCEFDGHSASDVLQRLSQL